MILDKATQLMASFKNIAETKRLEEDVKPLVYAELIAELGHKESLDEDEISIMIAEPSSSKKSITKANTFSILRPEGSREALQITPKQQEKLW